MRESAVAHRACPWQHRGPLARNDQVIRQWLRNAGLVLVRVADERVNRPRPSGRTWQITTCNRSETCTELGDVDRAIAAWRRLVDSPARARALAALEPLYEQRSEWMAVHRVLGSYGKAASV